MNKLAMSPILTNTEAAEQFNRDPVVISKGIKGLEKKIREDETMVTAITMLQDSFSKNRKKYLFC